MNAVVTTWWRNGSRTTLEMPEHMVAEYLAKQPLDLRKGYIVDAVPEDIKPRVPSPNDEVTIFPVRQSGKIHAAFLVDADTDAWATRCGKSVRVAADVEHRVAAIECEDCILQVERGRLARKTAAWGSKEKK